jgi:hypothetical protein
MRGPINVKSPNNTSKWQMGFNSAFKGLRRSISDDISWQCGAIYFSQRFEMTDLPETTKPSEAENVSGSHLSLITLRSFIRALHLA